MERIKTGKNRGGDQAQAINTEEVASRAGKTTPIAIKGRI